MLRAALVLPVGAPPIRDGAVAVEDGRVVAVGPAGEVEGRVLREWPGALLPGLVNAHAHLEYGASFADLAGAGLAFPDWIVELSGRRRQTDTDTWTENARTGAAAMLASGTTSVADVVSYGPALAVAEEAGLGGVSYVEAVGADAAGWADREQDRVLGLLAGAPRGRTVGLSPHTLYTLSGAVVQAVVALARARGLRVHPHLAESAAEAEFVLAGTGPIAAALDQLALAHELSGRGAGCTPAVRLDWLSGLGPDVHVAHGVHLDSADRALLRRRHSAVALCVRSNAILGAGEAPVAAYRSEGSPVAIGTDSLASSPDLDLLAELRAVRRLALAQGSPLAGLDRWLVAVATAGGAAALGLRDAGVLRPGARADLVLVDSDPAEGETGVVHGRVAATLRAGQLGAGQLGVGQLGVGP
ncbi:MAG: amidohydrolase family protein [Mycobacteriales bacterium]